MNKNGLYLIVKMVLIGFLVSYENLDIRKEGEYVKIGNPSLKERV